MRPWSIGVLIAVFLLSACQQETSQVSGVLDQTEEEDKEEVTRQVSEAWKKDYDMDLLSLEFSVPDYIAEVKDYSFDLNSLDNPQEFSGFSQGQKQLLEQNGFVALRPSAYTPLKMHQVYETADYDDIPTFITTDAILNMYHIFYGDSMKYFELREYYPRLQELSLSMYKKSFESYQDSAGTMREALGKVVAYYGVAASLLGQSVEVPKELSESVSTELERIMSGQAYEESELFGQKIDYSQFIVRGHYTLSEDLERFFRGMMWYGYTGFKLTTASDSQEIVHLDEVRYALIITSLLMEGEIDDIENWRAIYELTSLYSGTSDDLHILDMVDVIQSVYGQDPDIDMLFDSSYDTKLEGAILKLRQPEIVAKILGEVTAGKHFKFMGQRFTLDAALMQPLVEPYKRPLPSSFDLLAAFGHEEAENILYSYYPTNQKWPEFDQMLLEAKDKVTHLNDEFYQRDLYHGWLWSIDTAAQSFEHETGMPTFMKNRAWTHKSLSTALGSFTELKYDNILYSKQVMAEMGGDIEVPTKHYVEPNVKLYAKMLWLIQTTKVNLSEKIQDANHEESILEPLDNMEEMLELLLTCSIKELENQPLTEEEFVGLSRVGGLIDYVNFSYMMMLRAEGYSIEDEDSSAIVVDIAGTTDGYYEQCAIGMPYEIYVIVEINGDKLLTKGSVYSFYEFTSQKRMTTEEWLPMVGIEKVEVDENYSYSQYTGEKVDLLDMMPWMRSYISPEANNVVVTPKEVDWDAYN